MLRNPITIVTEAKWKVSDVNGRVISVMIGSSLCQATLEITDDDIDLEHELPPKGGEGLIKRVIGVRLDRKPTGQVSLVVNLKKSRPIAQVPMDYYLTQKDWDTLVETDFADPIRPGE